MSALKWTLAVGSLICAAPAPAQTVEQWRLLINEASARFGVPEVWIERVMQAESRGRTHVGRRPIRSAAGAMGLMQLMPGTWAEMRAQLHLGHDPDDPRDNILAGTFYLRLMYDRFGYPGLFAGPGRYARHLAGRSTLPVETVGYLANVAPSTRINAPSTPPLTIFAVRKADATANPEAASSQNTSPRFIALSQGN